jgi:DNA-binding transcriptional LysR family regulator
MAALSSRLNRPLFEQAPPKRLTEWARDAAFNARQALREIAEAEAALRGRRAGGRATVRLRVGALPASRVYLVPEAARRFAADHAACEVSILDADYETLLSHLRSGEIELVIGSIRPGALPAWTAAESLFEDHLVVASRPDHPLQGLPAVDWWDLRSARWVLPGRRTPIRLEFDRLLASNGIPAPAQIVEVDSFIAARAFLLTGEWLGIFSASQIIPEERAKLLKRLPMSRLGEPRRVGAMTRRHETASAQLKAFLAHLRDAAAELARDLRHGSSRTKPAGPKLIWRDRN